MQRGALAALHVRAARDLGRHSAALQALRGVPRRRTAEAAQLSLDEAEALLDLHRCREAAAVTGRALRRGVDDADLAARLRCVHAQALGRAGRMAAARREATSAAAQAVAPLTRARCDELLARLAREEGHSEEAARGLESARRAYTAGGDLAGLVRVLGLEAGLRRDAGRLRDALALLTERVSLARATTRLDLQALAHHERALLLVSLGRWQDARADADAARALFKGLDDPREFTLAGVAAARIAIAAGRPAEARAGLERARALLEEAGGEPATLGEVGLALSDVHLAAGAAEDACREAGAALRAFVVARQREGRGRAGVRLAHALVALGRHGEAARAARRAVRDAQAGPRYLRALAALTLGRALMRVDRRAARAAFAESEACAGVRHAFGRLARLGRALAGAASGSASQREVNEGLEALAQWGDERLLALGRADLAELTGAAPAGAAPAGDVPAGDVPPAPAGSAPEPVEAASGSARRDDETAAFPGIVGRCGSMRTLYGDMRCMAASDVPVFVLGETGTGKEKVARALHDHSRRRHRPFVAVNASALNDELFDAEMFGHARGAFTGAVMAREGLLAQAEGGTLFLDEVADLSPRAQVKLLRFLQEREYRRVGESELRKSDVRIVSAANRDLEACVAAGTFREDLLYRLNHVVLRLPALRERGDDVLLLARHFVRQAAQRTGGGVPALTPELCRHLAACAWPGNIRQLENEMDRLVALSRGGPLRIEDLSPRVRGTAAEGAARRTATLPLRAAQLEFERDFVGRALVHHAGNRARTAVALGITRQALLLKIQRLGLT